MCLVGFHLLDVNNPAGGVDEGNGKRQMRVHHPIGLPRERRIDKQHPLVYRQISSFGQPAGAGGGCKGQLHFERMALYMHR